MSSSTVELRFAGSEAGDRLDERLTIVDVFGAIIWYQPNFADHWKQVVAGITAAVVRASH